MIKTPVRFLVAAALLTSGVLPAINGSTPLPFAITSASAQQLAGFSRNDRAQGQQAYEAIVREFGGKVEGSLADYVRSVGLKVAQPASPRSKASDWTFTVLNSPVPNAMATPGGYVYITRGLLAMINSEAELASVLGHEAGHITARHTDKRNSRATIAGLGSVLAGVLLGNQGAQIASTVGSGLVAGYSRGQEHEADELGMSYSAAAGYDPAAAARMLAALDRVSAVEGQQSMERGGLQSIFSSHPVTRERIDRVARLATNVRTRQAIRNEQAFLNAIDGMAFGDAMDQGIVSGNSFRHGALGFGFDAPQGFQLQNSPSAVVGQSSSGARFQFQGANVRAGDSLQSVVSQAWSQLLKTNQPNASYTDRRINGMEALVSTASAYSGSNRMDLGITAYRFAPDTVYLITTVAPSGQGQIFGPLLSSMRRLNVEEKREASRGRRIQVVTVRASDTLQSLAQRMSPPYNRVESLLALNGLPPDSPLAAGSRLKLVVN